MINSSLNPLIPTKVGIHFAVWKMDPVLQRGERNYYDVEVNL